MVYRHMALAHASTEAINAGKMTTSYLPDGPIPPIAKAFEYLSLAKVAGSAQEAQDMLILNQKSGISMNRRRVLADAKLRCLDLAKDYAVPEWKALHLPGPAGRDALNMAVDNVVASGKATPHDEVVCKHLARVLTVWSLVRMRSVFHWVLISASLCLRQIRRAGI